jgi:hypothetical protein
MKNLDPKKAQALLARYDALFAEAGLLSPRTEERLDANETAFLTRKIEHVRSTVYEVKYASLLSRSFLPTATDIPSWASHVVEVVYDTSGRATIVANGADDVKRVDNVVSEQSYKVFSIASAYGYSLNDLRTALGSGQPLSDLKARTVRRVIDTGIDEIIATGKLATVGQDPGAVGFVNAASVPIVTPVDGDWNTATPDEMIADLNALVSAPGNTTIQVFEANIVLLAPKQYDKAARTRIGATNETTVLEFFLKTNPGVTVQKWHRLSGAGAGGKDRCIAYSKSPEIIEAIVPLEFEQLPPQVKNFDTVVLCHARCGGVRIHQPKAIAYLDLVLLP